METGYSPGNGEYPVQLGTPTQDGNGKWSAPLASSGPYTVQFQTPQQVEGGYTEIVGNGANVTGVGTDFIIATDISAFKSFALQLSGTFSLSLQVQVSNDGANYTVMDIVGLNAFGTIYGSLASTGIYFANIGFRYLRVRCTAYSSNASLAGVLELYNFALPIGSPYGQQYVFDVGGASIASGQVSVGTSATQIVAARAMRKEVVIVNTSTTIVYLGASGVTTGTGLYLAGVAGQLIKLRTAAAVYGIVATGTETVSFMEEY